MCKLVIIALGATPEIQRNNQCQAMRMMMNGRHKIPQQCKRVSNGVWVKSKNEWKNRKGRVSGKIWPCSANPTVSPAAVPVWPLTIHCTDLGVMGHGECNWIIHLILCILHCRSCRYNCCGAISVYLLLVGFPQQILIYVILCDCICKWLIANVIELNLKWIAFEIKFWFLFIFNHLREFGVQCLVFRLSYLMLFFFSHQKHDHIHSNLSVMVSTIQCFNTVLSVHCPCCGSMKMQPVWCFQERETDISTTFTSLMHEGFTKGKGRQSQAKKKMLESDNSVLFTDKKINSWWHYWK